MHGLTAMAILAVEEGGEGAGGLSLVLPHRDELIAGIIAFAIVFFFVWKWALPAVNRSLEQRQSAIAGQIAEAEKAKAEAESLLGDYRSQMNEAKAEGNRIIEEARHQGEQVKADILARAEAEGEQIREKARTEAAREMERALAEARSRVGDISVDLAGKIVGESLDEEAHRALIDRYLADLEKL
ncbi:MAG TPA: F0F1 ATP synthase subunit B [Acidimicrobiia bacterium]|nr:F0F1 ATP synthase subunit B [Acidimicrobiia bacterium]